MRSLAALSVLTVVCGCAGGAARAPQQPEPARARAALATLHVDNRSGERLVIMYRLTSRTSSEIGVGRVEANAAAELAPVPAGEPLILIARTAAGTELMLPAITFPIDGYWVWVIPVDARFVRGGGGS